MRGKMKHKDVQNGRSHLLYYLSSGALVKGGLKSFGSNTNLDKGH